MGWNTEPTTTLVQSSPSLYIYSETHIIHYHYIQQKENKSWKTDNRFLKTQWTMTFISGTKQTKDLECYEHEHAFPFLASNKILGQLCSLWSTITKLYNRAWKAGRHIIVTEEIFSISQHAYTFLWPDNALSEPQVWGSIQVMLVFQCDKRPCFSFACRGVLHTGYTKSPLPTQHNTLILSMSRAVLHMNYDKICFLIWCKSPACRGTLNKGSC